MPKSVKRDAQLLLYIAKNQKKLTDAINNFECDFSQTQNSLANNEMAKDSGSLSPREPESKILILPFSPASPHYVKTVIVNPYHRASPGAAFWIFRFFSNRSPSSLQADSPIQGSRARKGPRLADDHRIR